MTADMFHITRVRDADNIFDSGLKRSSPSPARKNEQDLIDEMDDEPIDPMMEGPTQQAERWFDEVVADAKRAVDEASTYPKHQPANFFWPSKAQAIESSKSVPWAAVMVAVDREDMPDDCRCAIGPTSRIDVIFKEYWDTARDRFSFDPEQQFERAKEWWREVEWYEGGNRRAHEIWCGCDIPSAAIEWIENPTTGRRLYEPPGAGQMTLREFMQEGP